MLEQEAPAAGPTGSADGAVSVASKKAGPMMQAALAGISLYRRLEDEGLFQGAFKRRSTYVIANSAAEAEVLARHTEALNATGVPTQTYDGAALHNRFPGLAASTCLMTEVQADGHAIGYQITHRLLTAAGVKVARKTKVRALERSANGARIEAVLLEDERIRADRFFICAGSGSEALLGLDGVTIPRKGQLLVTERASWLNRPMPGAIMSGRYLLSKGAQKGATTARGYGLVIDPLVTGQFLIGGTREEGVSSRELNDIEAVTQILRDAVEVVPDLAKLRLLRSFAGVRTAVRDGLPIVGAVTGLENLWVSTGFEGDGICLGPVMARTVVELAQGGTPSVDISAFDPNRFFPAAEAVA